MATFFMMGKYSLPAIKGISSGRTGKVNSIIRKCGGRVQSMHALLGKYDLAFIVDFPSMRETIKASIAITKLTGISFASFPAISVREFDKLIG